MKSIAKVLMIMALTAPASAGASSAERVEMPIQNVLLPARGFDDNDHVQAMVSGELPHACYTLGQTVVERMPGNVLRLRQLAWTKRTGVCADREIDEWPVSYTSEISLGKLKAGRYEIEFRDGGRVKRRSFKVATAETDIIDDYSYANVSDVAVPLLVVEKEPIRVTLRGLIDVSCAALGERVKIERQGDVLVVLPIETRNMTGTCSKKIRQFSRTFTTDGLPAGEYLIHVRSKNGKAVNQIFDVQPASS